MAFGDRVIPIGAPKQRALLALLLLHANETLSSDRLVDELWGERPPATAASALRVHMTQLRKLLAQATTDGLLATQPRGYVLRLGRHELDLHRFEALVAEGTQALLERSWADAAGALADALGLWRGHALEDLLDHRFAQLEGERLEELRLRALEKRLDAELALGRHADLVAELETLVAGNPVRESFRGQLMLALYRSGRQAEALTAYRDARQTLVDQLGIDPSPALQRLERAILRQQVDLDRSAAADEPATLPREPTTFVGRERELERLRATLTSGDTRLLTLTGTGGSGKTRLAVRAAREAAPTFRDGVVFVSLTGLVDPSLVLPAVAQAVGVPETTSLPLADTLTTHLWDKRTLLVLDNFEHVLPAAVEVTRLVESCSSISVLATSRIPLRVEGEHEFEVLPLEVPAADATYDEVVQSEAVQLFAERAQATRRGFAVTDANASALAQICARLDGLPLAIELAAARTRMLSPAAILARLEGRLELAAEGEPPSRHQTLRSSIVWSHELLSERERQLFRRLGVFRGGWTVAAAEAVDATGTDTFATLASLVQHNLVTTRWSADAELRFDLLETIAEFARERLVESGEVAETQSRHADFFGAFADEAETEIWSPEQRAKLDRLDEERDNLRAALDWLSADDPAAYVRVAGALGTYWYVRGRFREGLARLRAAVRLPNVDGAARARVLCRAATLERLSGGDQVHVKEYLLEAASLSREIGDVGATASALNELAHLASADGEDAEAVALWEEVERSCRAGGLLYMVGVSIVNRAGLAVERGRFDEATALASDGLELFESVGVEQGVGRALLILARARVRTGDAASAAEPVARALLHYRVVGAKSPMIECLEVAAEILEHGGDTERAAELQSAARDLRQGLAAGTGTERELNRAIELALAALG